MKKSKYNIQWTVFIFLMLVMSASVQAEVRSSVDRTELALGESLQLTVSISGGDQGSVDISPIKDFKVISRGQTSSIQMINGRFSQEISYNYTLIPVKEGRLIIPRLPVISGSSTFHTREIAVMVSKNPRYTNNSREIFVMAEISDTSPYESQQIVYTFKFFQSVQTANAKLEQLDFSGFTASKAGDDKVYRTVISGKEYRVTELNYVLMPMKTGQISIEPAVLSCDIVRQSSRRGGIFDDPFFSFGRNLEPRELRTESMLLDVKPLPRYEGPGKFSGLVGEFDIHSQIETKELNAGDSVTLSLFIEGTGNIMDAEAPEAHIPDSFKIYNDSPEDSVQLDAKGYSGKKLFRMALVPVQAGDYDLPPVSLVYFDISKGQYVTKNTGMIHLKVNPSKEHDNLEVFSSPSQDKKISLKKKVEFTGRDILPLKEDLDALQNQKSLSLLHFILFLSCPAGLCLIAKFAVMLTQKNGEPRRIMAERAEKALKEAGKSDSTGPEFLSSLYRALISLVFSKSGSMGESLTCAETINILTSKGYSLEIAEQAAGLLDKIESAKFSGTAVDDESRKQLLSDIRQMFRTLS